MEKWYLLNNLENYKKIKDNPNFTSFQKLILANRDIIDDFSLNTFSNPKIENMHNPLLMTDMEKGVEVLFETILNNGKIRIVGDYDQDGVAATVILLKGIGLFYKDISYAIPDRIEDGYGINKNIIDNCIKDNIKLVITCDNGVSAIEAIEYAKENNIKVIVTDHHEPIVKENIEILPNADAVINPHRKNDIYPFKDICGAMVAYKFIVAIYNLYGNKLGIDKNKIINLIQFAALGTVCDMMKIVDENRIALIEGLKIMNTSPNLGLKVLLEEINWQNDVNIYTIGFLIGPTINASGRIYTAMLGVELFLETNPDIIKEYAITLVELNNERKKLTTDAVKIANENIISKKLDNNDIIVLYNENFHESICGLVAGRIKDKYNRPTLVFTNSNTEGIIKGSGRSIKTYDMYTNLSLFRDYFESFGGHTMACGLSLKFENLDKFSYLINKESKLTSEDFMKDIEIDYNLSFNRISNNLVSELDSLRPFGYGFNEPVFATKNVKINSLKILGKNKNVVKLILNDKGSIKEAISFDIDLIIENLKQKYGIEGQEDFYKLEGQYIDIVYKISINTYNGISNIQLNIVTLR